MEKLNVYKVSCRIDGKESPSTIINAHNTNEAFMMYLKSISAASGNLPKDYKITVNKMAQEGLCNGGKFLYMLDAFGCVGNYLQFWQK